MNADPFEILYKFSDPDMNFFKQHGLNPGGKIKYAETVHAGKIVLSNGYVDLSATFYPATFWKAEIYSNVTGKTYHVSTGSGSLTNRFFGETPYWNKMIDLVNGKSVEFDDMFGLDE